MAPIDIDWKAMFSDLGCSEDRQEVCVASSTPTPARTRAGAGRGEPKGDTPGLRSYQTRSGRRYGDGGAGERGRRSWLERLDEDSKVSDGIGRGARAPETDVFAFGPDDAKGESVSRRFCEKKSPVSSGKKNYGQLQTSSGGRLRHVGFGERKPISVVPMYSSNPSSASFSAHQQRVKAIDPKEVDYENFRWSQDHSVSNYSFKRRKQHQDSASHDTEKVEDVVLLDDEVQPGENDGCRTPDKQIESKIYYPSRDDPEAVELSGSDIKCLEPGVFLSSPVINYYIQYIKRTKLPTEDKFYIFNTYFYSKLEEALFRTSGFNKLRRWWKGVNIFHRAYIILPIHGMAHWSLIIICIPGKESDSGPIILHLDSLGMHSSTNIFGTVKRYLEEEWRYMKNNPPPDTSISESVWEDLQSNIHTRIVQVPQQNNAYDCGVFMLYYLERFVREAPERFTRDNLGMFSHSWFNAEDASKLRERIQALLQEEFESARLDDAMSDAASYDSSDKEDIIKGGELEAVAPSDSSEMLIECVNSGDNGKNDEGFKVAATEEGSGESGGTGKSSVGIVEVRALDEVPTVSTRHDESLDGHDENVDCVVSGAANFSDSIAWSDSSNSEEEEFAIVSPDRWKSHGEALTSTPCPDIVCDSCDSDSSDSSDSDSDDVMIVEGPKGRETRKNCLFI